MFASTSDVKATAKHMHKRPAPYSRGYQKQTSAMQTLRRPNEPEAANKYRAWALRRWPQPGCSSRPWPPPALEPERSCAWQRLAAGGDVYVRNKWEDQKQLTGNFNVIRPKRTMVNSSLQEHLQFLALKHLDGRELGAAPNLVRAPS